MSAKITSNQTTLILQVFVCCRLLRWARMSQLVCAAADLCIVIVTVRACLCRCTCRPSVKTQVGWSLLGSAADQRRHGHRAPSPGGRQPPALGRRPAALHAARQHQPAKGGQLGRQQQARGVHLLLRQRRRTGGRRHRRALWHHLTQLRRLPRHAAGRSAAAQSEPTSAPVCHQAPAQLQYDARATDPHEQLQQGVLQRLAHRQPGGVWNKVQ